MDKRSLIGLVLITLIVTVWLFFTSINQQPEIVDKKKNEKTSQSDTINKAPEIKVDSIAQQGQKHDSIISSNVWNDKYGKFAQFATGNREVITIENELTKVMLTNQGASILRLYLNEFKKWDKEQVQLIWENESQLFLNFVTYENKRIDTRNLFFKFDSPNKEIKIKGNDSVTINATLEIAEGKSIVRSYTFYGNSYTFKTEIALNNLDDVIPQRGYNLQWTNGLRYQEHNSVDESSDAVVTTSLNGEIEELDASGNEQVESNYTGIVDFAAIKIKYFTAAIIPSPYKSFDGTIDLSGKRTMFYKGDERRNSTVEKYNITFRVPYKGGQQSNSFLIYAGPLNYDILKEYGWGLENLINFGWRLIIRPIGEYFMLPIFKFIHSFVPNYGIAIIIFSILMKILLYPLSISQLKSAQKMQLLGPEMNSIREKYKDDQQKQQQETMRLYSEYGINPMGGCLPLLLQMPILYALWAVLRLAIDLRQEGFTLWITDLSVPDYILDFGFKLPLLGVDKLSGLALLMGATLFIQQKMSVTDPRQQGLVYIMPIMFTLMFANFPSGLNLYYFMFNVLGIAQQIYMTKFSKNKLTLADLKKMPKKEGWLQKKMREAQELAASQGKSIPGQTNTGNKPQQNRRKKK